jgi:hypothetical protein
VNDSLAVLMVKLKVGCLVGFLNCWLKAEKLDARWVALKVAFTDDSMELLDDEMIVLKFENLVYS